MDAEQFERRLTAFYEKLFPNDEQSMKTNSWPDEMEQIPLMTDNELTKNDKREKDITDIPLDVYKINQRLSIVETNAIFLNQEMANLRAKLARMEMRLEKMEANQHCRV